MQRTIKFTADVGEGFCPGNCFECPLLYSEYVDYDEGEGYTDTDYIDRCAMGWSYDECKLEVSE